jgi:nitroreductase
MIDNRSILSKISEIIGYNYLYTAKAMIAVISDPSVTYSDMTFYKEDYAAAVENILLAVTDLGYASLWIDGVLRRERRAERIGEILNIPDNRILTVLLPIGKPSEKHKQCKKKNFSERAWFNSYKA